MGSQAQLLKTTVCSHLFPRHFSSPSSQSSDDSLPQVVLPPLSMDYAYNCLFSHVHRGLEAVDPFRSLASYLRGSVWSRALWVPRNLMVPKNFVRQGSQSCWVWLQIFLESHVKTARSRGGTGLGSHLFQVTKLKPGLLWEKTPQKCLQDELGAYSLACTGPAFSEDSFQSPCMSVQA